MNPIEKQPSLPALGSFFETKQEPPPNLIEQNPLFPTRSSSTLSKSELPSLEILLEEELDSLLQKKEQQITTEMDKVNNAVKESRFYKIILDFSKWAHEHVEGSNDAIQDGIEFLQNILPENLLKQESFLVSRLDTLDELASQAGKFLKAIDIGVSGLTLRYKSNILEISKQVLENLKIEYRQKTEKLLDPKIGRDELSQLRKELAELDKIIQEFQIKLKFQEKQLLLQKAKYKVKAAKNFFSLIKTPLSYLPIDQTTKFFNAIIQGVTVIKTALVVVLSGFILHRNSTQHLTYQGWSEAFEQWKRQQQPRGEILVDQTPSSLPLKAPPINLATEIQTVLFAKSEKDLDSLIHSQMTLSEIQLHLKNFGINLPSDTVSFDLLINKWLLDKDFKQQLIFQYTNFNLVLQELDKIIQTSQNLLVKREAIAKKKRLQLEPHFEEIKPQILQLKRVQYQGLIEKFRKTYQEKFSIENLSPSVFLKLSREQIEILSQEEIELRTKNYLQHLSPKEYNQISNRQQMLFQEKKLIKLQEIADQLKLPFQISNFNHSQQIIDSFESLIAKAEDKQFERFIASTDQATLLDFYIAHHETLEQVTKNSLKEMISKKHEIDLKFTKFQLIESATLFTLGAISAIISITFAIIGLITTPIAGAGIILLCLSMASSIISFGFLGASYYQKFKYRPAISSVDMFFTDLKLMFNRVRSAIEDYQALSKKKKLQDTAQILKNLHQETKSPKYEKALLKYEQAKIDYALNQSKIDKWKRNIKAIENRMDAARLKDFSQSASLNSAENPALFDTWKALNESLLALDLRLISEETKILLETQLGFNLESLQAKAEKDPEGVKKALQKFFALEDSEFVSFVQYQQERLRNNLIPSMTPNQV